MGASRECDVDPLVHQDARVRPANRLYACLDKSRQLGALQGSLSNLNEMDTRRRCNRHTLDDIGHELVGDQRAAGDQADDRSHSESSSNPASRSMATGGQSPSREKNTEISSAMPTHTFTMSSPVTAPLIKLFVMSVCSA